MRFAVFGGDRDVAWMIARYAGASLGLLAFAIAVMGGLATRNPFTVTLSRGILAMFVFCLIGLVLGRLAQMVVSEHETKRETEIRAHFADGTAAGKTPTGGASSGGLGTPPGI